MKLLGAPEDERTTKTRKLFVEHIVDIKERKYGWNAKKILLESAQRLLKKGEEFHLKEHLKNDSLHAPTGHWIKHSETKLKRSMWACTIEVDRLRETHAKLVAVNFVK